MHITFQAQTATLAIAQAFNLAFDKWKQKENQGDERTKCKRCRCQCDNNKVAEVDTINIDTISDRLHPGMFCRNDVEKLANSDDQLLIDLESPDCKSQGDGKSIRIENCESISNTEQLVWPTIMDSKLNSPVHGSCLTPSKLMTPVPELKRINTEYE